MIRNISKRLAEVQSVRFLVAGGFNTLFGVADSLLLLKLLLALQPAQPKLMGTAAMALSSVVNIAVSFLSYKWFLGENTLRAPLYDHETKGCCDGLLPTGINRTQGAESTLAYLISHLTVLKAFELEYEYNKIGQYVESF